MTGKRPRSDRRGFTLIELLVVIAIIGVLSTLAVVAVKRAQVLARESRAKNDIAAARDAIALLLADTGKWPGGCKPDVISNPEINLMSAQVGLTQAPTVGTVDTGCAWTAKDVAAWRGPYLYVKKDPWKHDYYFDPDYEPYQNCPSKTRGPQAPVVLSFGPNGAGVNAYDCDDIFLQLR